MILLKKDQLVILTLGLLSAFRLSAQTSVDSLPLGTPSVSLDSLVPNERNDTARIRSLANVFWPIIISYPDTAISVVREELILSKKLRLIQYEYDALAKLGYALFQQGNYPEGLAYEFDALAIAESLRDTLLIVETHNRIAEIYREEGDLSKSQAHLLFSKKLINPTDSVAMKTWYFFATPLYEKMNRLDTALEYARKSLMLDNRINASVERSVILFYMGNIYFKLGRNDSSLFYYHEAILYTKAFNTSKDLIPIYNSVAKLYMMQGNNDSSIYYANLALETEKKMGYSPGKLETCRTLSDLYLRKNKKDSAIRYLQLSVETQDSILSQEKLRQLATLEFNKRIHIEEELIRQEHLASEFRIYIMATAILVFVIMISLLILNNRIKQKAFRKLEQQEHETEIQRQRAEKALTELNTFQGQSIQSERLSSWVGADAGAAQDIQHPANIVGNIHEDIMEKGTVQPAAGLKGLKQGIDLNSFLTQYLKLSFTEIKHKDKTFPCEIKTDFDTTIRSATLVPQDFGRLLLNVFNNAFYTLAEKRRRDGDAFSPQLLVKTRALNGRIEISVLDNGMGMPPDLVGKIFQPFFTTKPPGQGAGLGLSMGYDIIKAHGGEISVASGVDKGTEFTICLPGSAG